VGGREIKPVLAGASSVHVTWRTWVDGSNSIWETASENENDAVVMWAGIGYGIMY
jgi:hypothetical protein